MGPFAAGQIVLLPFPFSDLSQSKFRPAVLLGHAGGVDWIACQITSNPYSDQQAIALDSAAFARGSLQRASYVRPGKLFTASEVLMTASPATISDPMLARIRDAVVALIRGSEP